MIRKVIFLSTFLAFTTHYASAHCGDGQCGQLMGGDVKMHPVDELTGYVCYPYQYQTKQDASQTLGFLDGNGVSEHYHKATDAFSNSDLVEQKPIAKKHKPKKRKTTKQKPAAEPIKDAYNEDAKPQSHFQEKKIEEITPAPTPEVKATPMTQLPSAEQKPMSTPELPTESTPAPVATVAPNNYYGGRTAVIDFTEKEVELSPDQATALNSIADDLRNADGLVVKIRSYGHASDGNTSEARRKSLQRAIKIRKYLLDKDINPSRISVNSIDDSQNSLNKVEIMLENARS